MGDMTDKVAFLRGLAEGMNLNPDTPENKLLLKMLEVLGDFSQELEVLREEQDELIDYVDSLDEDLADLEEALFDDEDLFDDEGVEGEMEYECPHCGYQTKFDLADFDFEEDYLCPQCHRSFFPEVEDDEEDGEDQGDEDKQG